MTEWIAGIIGVVVGGLVALIGTYFTVKLGHRTLYAQTVSQSRNIWLNELRGYISKMLSAVYDDKEAKQIDKVKYYENRAQVLMRLNNTEPSHVAMEKLIKKLDEKMGEKQKDPTAEIDKTVHDSIIEMARLILKPEWEKVKEEAGGKK